MKVAAHISGLHYKINDIPPWPATIFLGFQQYLVLLSANLATPTILASIICAETNPVITSEIMGNILVACGFATLLQNVFGTRLPILQCPSFSFIVPMLALLNVEDWKCPTIEPDFTVGNLTSNTLEMTEETSSRIQMLSGTIMVVAVIEIVIGATGLVGLLMRFIGPLTVSPTLMLIGLSLADKASNMAGGHWLIALITIALIILLSECLPIFHLKLPTLRKRCSITKAKEGTQIIFHKIFSVIIAVSVMWFVCYILTITDSLPSNENKYGYKARTDIRTKAIKDAKWFRFPYPGEWGMPKFNIAMFAGLFASIFTSTIESIGDYYACARLSGAPPPPPHAINRGITCEGIGCVISGSLAAGCGVTSCSQNIGAISLTKVGSRRVAQVAGVMLVVFGCFGKFSAVIVSMPEPIVGSSVLMLFGVIAAVGASNLQYANLNSSRNLLVFGLAMFLGLSIPRWSTRNADLLKTGNTNFDHVISVLLGTSMFVGCVVALVLDNLLPGSEEERGIAAWKTDAHGDSGEFGSHQDIVGAQKESYDLPFGNDFIRTLNWTKYIPCSPSYQGVTVNCCQRMTSKAHLSEGNEKVHTTELDDSWHGNDDEHQQSEEGMVLTASKL